MRPPFALGRGTVAAITVLLMVALVAMFARHGASPPPQASAMSADRVLDRCNTGGMKALDDPACQAAWKAARERFLSVPRRARP